MLASWCDLVKETQCYLLDSQNLLSVVLAWPCIPCHDIRNTNINHSKRLFFVWGMHDPLIQGHRGRGEGNNLTRSPTLCVRYYLIGVYYLPLLFYTPIILVHRESDLTSWYMTFTVALSPSWFARYLLIAIVTRKISRKFYCTWQKRFQWRHYAAGNEAHHDG